MDSDKATLALLNPTLRVQISWVRIAWNSKWGVVNNVTNNLFRVYGLDILMLSVTIVI